MIVFVAIALLVFLAAIIFPTGDWLQIALQHQEYNLDEIIVGVVATSFIMAIFLIRGSGRARLAAQVEQRAAINAQLSQMTSLLHSCFTLEEASEIIAHFARRLFHAHLLVGPHSHSVYVKHLAPHARFGSH